VHSTATAHRPFAAQPKSGALLDVAIATVALGVSCALLAHGGIGSSRLGSELDVLGGLLAATAAVPLLAWRRAPFSVFVLAAAASTLTAGLGYALGIPPAPTIALYLMTASRTQSRPWIRRATATTLALFVAYLATTAAAEGALPETELLHMGLAWALAWFAGDRTRLAHEHIAELVERAQRTQRDAERDRRVAAAEERTRIARDIHDSAGQAVSVIALRAGTARLRHDEDPERSRFALEAIEELARRTADEIDEIVGTLRDDGTPRGTVEAPVGLASLATLVEQHASTGLDITVHRAGEPRPLGGPADQAAYRILQESLSNAARHGTGSADVELVFRDGGIELTVVNPVGSAGQASSTGRHGLIGMRERATLLGGEFRAERADGTFRLRARLPDHAP
jgi:signal transduction histidine kinase